MKPDSGLAVVTTISGLGMLLTFASAIFAPQNMVLFVTMSGITTGALSSLYTLLKQLHPEFPLPQLPAGTSGTQTVTTQQVATTPAEPEAKP